MEKGKKRLLGAFHRLRYRYNMTYYVCRSHACIYHCCFIFSLQMSGVTNTKGVEHATSADGTRDSADSVNAIKQRYGEPVSNCAWATVTNC